MQLYHVRITLHQETGIFFPDFIPGVKDTVKGITLMINKRFGRIYILGCFGPAAKYPSPETNHPSGKIMDRENNAPPKPVIKAASFLVFYRKPRSNKGFFAEAVCKSLPGKRFPFISGIT